MAQQRGRSQARRNGSRNASGLPGWAWLVMGVVLALVVVMVAPRFLHGAGDGLFHPKPNPDAQPKSASDDEAALTPDATTQAGGTADATGKSKTEDYSFYDVLPGDEVKLTDAQLAAMARAEAKRKAAPDAAAAATPAATALPTPIDGTASTPAADATPPTVAATPKPRPVEVAKAEPAPVASVPKAVVQTPQGTQVPIAKTISATADTPYLLQAGAFGAAGDAEAVKAKIALLGLNARVESAAINGKTVYRVRMGPYATAAELAAAKGKLGSGGLSAMAIKAK